MARNNNVRVSLASSGRELQELDEFRQIVRMIKSAINSIKLTNDEMLELRKKLPTAVSTKQQQQKLELTSQTYSLTQKNRESIVKIKEWLDKLTEIIKKQKEVNPQEPQTMSKIYQKNFLMKQVDSLIRNTEKIQLLYEKKSTQTITKRIMMLDPSISENDAQQIAKSDNGYQKFLKQKTIGKASQKLVDRVRDIVQKSQQVKRLTKSIQQNLVMMKQIAMLVRQQGEMIDNIQQNLLTAKDYVEKATKVLNEQKKQHQKSRKKMCCIILIGIVIIALVVVLIVVPKVKNSTTN